MFTIDKGLRCSTPHGYLRYRRGRSTCHSKHILYIRVHCIVSSRVFANAVHTVYVKHIENLQNKDLSIQLNLNKLLYEASMDKN